MEVNPSEKSSFRKRDDTIDIVRGIAIFTMIASNLTPYLLDGDSPKWFRFYGTFAAPLFVFLAGMMIKLAGENRQHSFGYYLVRGTAVVVVGAGIDTYIWGLVPFLTMDVLYLIGLSMPLCYLLGKFPIALQYIFTFAIFAFTPFLQEWLPYRHSPDGFMVASGITFAEVVDQAQFVRGWAIDGWFPVFPWLGVAFAGYLSGERRLKSLSFADAKVLMLGLGSLGVGLCWWLLYPIERFARGGYPDLFYPPTNAFFLVAAGVIALLFYVVDQTKTNFFYGPFKLYGKCSLLMYILHTVVIGEYFRDQGQEGLTLQFGAFLQVYLIFTAGLLLVAWMISLVKPKNLHPAIRFLVGS